MTTTVLKQKKYETGFGIIELSPLEIKILEKVKKSKIDLREGRYEDARTFFKRFKKERNIK